MFKIRNVVAIFLIVSTVEAVCAQEVWRVSDVDQRGQWTIYNRTANGSLLGMPVTLGDLNGDMMADAVLTPMNADSGPDRSRPSAGELSIVLSSGVLAGEIDLALVSPDNLPESVTLVYGRDPRDLLGTETAAADIDGDGYDDIIAGAQLGDGPNNSRPGSGEVVIVWGGPDFGGQVIDTADQDADVSFVYGADAGDRLGVWVFFGDLDGDGIQDAILGADQGDGPDNNRGDIGETYVIYGGSHLRAEREIDLANTTIARTVVYGIDPEDHSGTTVRAGDLDGDGTDELIIGAGVNRLSASVAESGNGHGFRGGDGPEGDRDRAGEAYALFLGKDARPATIDLRSPPSSMVVVYGADAGDTFGEELFVGDFNGDGFGDIAVGAIVGDGPGNSRPNAGDLALIIGGPDLPGSIIDLRTPPDNVTIFHGRSAGAIAGDTAMFADVDADGMADLVIASPNEPVSGVRQVGTTHIFFGTAAPLPAVVDLGAIPGDLDYLLIEGSGVGDMLAYSMGAGDSDGDGITDVMLNVMDGDGFNNSLPSSGDAHVLSGRELSRAAGRPLRTATPTPTMGPPTPTLTMAPATPTPGGCPGDCDGDGRVTVAELVRGVRIVLGVEQLSACPAMDADGNGTVAVNELIGAVNAALGGCS